MAQLCYSLHSSKSHARSPSYSSLLLLCAGYSLFCSACLLHRSLYPPTWLLLPCLARKLWMGQQCLRFSVCSFTVECVFRGGGRGSGLRIWARCLRILTSPPSLGLDRTRSIRADLWSVTHKDLCKWTPWPQWLYNYYPTFRDPDGYFHSVSIPCSVPSVDI